MALAVGQDAFRNYRHKFSPKKFTQPQLFACLVLKTFFKTDYRGVQEILQDCSDLTATLGLESVPHFTTLQKAADRLLCRPQARQLLAASIRRSRGRRKRRPRIKRAAADSSGFDTGHASRYYVQRRAKGQKKSEKPGQKTTYKRFAKLEVIFDCDSHLILAVACGLGPRPDTDRMVPLLDEALLNVSIGDLFCDAGYDSEANHRHARRKRGVRSIIPAEAGRPSKNPPTGYYRRMMKRRLRTKRSRRRWGYGQRWQAETGFSMMKRRLAVYVAARSYQRQMRELRLLALTHNVMILPNL